MRIVAKKSHLYEQQCIIAQIQTLSPPSARAIPPCSIRMMTLQFCFIIGFFIISTVGAFEECAQTRTFSSPDSQEIHIQRYENIFPTELFERLSKELQSIPYQYGWKSNPAALVGGHWNYDVVNSLKENGVDVSRRLGNKTISDTWDYLRKVHFPDHALLRCYINAHTFGTEGYPHTDSVRACERTLVVYMNADWRIEWAGETIIFSDKADEILHAELPKANRAISFPSNVWHVARGVTRICPELRSTLVFKMSPKECSDPLRDRIQRLIVSDAVGADKMKHNSNTLAGHLLRVYDFLRNAGHSDLVCSAGAIHSIFGTNQYTIKALDKNAPKDVALVDECVGPEAVQLALIFARIKRPWQLETKLGAMDQQGMEISADVDVELEEINGSILIVSHKQFLELCAIEAANLFDEQGLNSFTNLNSYWK